ncbi:Clas II Aldolase and Adducin domain-containing protein [Cladophialophora immunda]|nr:Clas II Aldolase and Adducin domain-containing protein [Cladophialophora immunda]
MDECLRIISCFKGTSLNHFRGLKVIRSPGLPRMATTQSPSDKAVLQKYYRDIISGSHILHYHNVLDAFGHLSFRHPFNPQVFIMSRNAAPGTISSLDDLVEYYVEDAQPVNPNAPPGFLERCIHSECYKRYPAIQSVIHSHSEAVVPYSISGVPMRACYHMAGFLGTDVPVWDITEAQQADDISDLLVRNTRLGGSLANSFGAGGAGGDLPQHVVALMRGHGFTVLAGSIQDCVMRAVYTQKNAMIQTTALITRAAGGHTSDSIKYLSQKEVDDTTWSIRESAHRPWKLWLREVEASNLYSNSA